MKNQYIGKDIVAKYPLDISIYYRENGKFPDNFEINENFVCALNGERYFIHTRAVLPLKAFDTGVGFGLWVEVSRDDFMKYINLSDEEYANYKVEGILANEWPGFMNMKGSRVVVKAIDLKQKVYITDVLDVNDALFEISIRTMSDDKKGIDAIKKLVIAYANDPHYNDPI